MTKPSLARQPCAATLLALVVTVHAVGNTPWRPGRLQRGFRDSAGALATSENAHLLNGRSLKGVADHADRHHVIKSRWDAIMSEDYVSVDVTSSIIAMECQDSEISVTAVLPAPEIESFPSLHPAFWAEGTLLAGDGRWGCASTAAIYDYVKKSHSSGDEGVGLRTGGDGSSRFSLGDSEVKAFREQHADLHLPFYREITRVVGPTDSSSSLGTTGIATYIFRTADASFTQMFDSLSFNVDTVKVEGQTHSSHRPPEQQYNGGNSEAEESVDGLPVSGVPGRFHVGGVAVTNGTSADPGSIADGPRELLGGAYSQDFTFGGAALPISGLGAEVSAGGFSFSAKCTSCTLGVSSVALSLFGDFGTEGFGTYFNYIGAKVVAVPSAQFLLNFCAAVSADTSGKRVWKSAEFGKPLGDVRLGTNAFFVAVIPIEWSYYGYVKFKGSFGAEVTACVGNVGLQGLSGSIGGRIQVSSKSGLTIDKYTPTPHWPQPDPLKLDGKIELKFGVEVGLQVRLYEVFRISAGLKPYYGVAIVLNDEVWQRCGKNSLSIEPSAGVDFVAEIDDIKFEAGPISLTLDLPMLPTSYERPILSVPLPAKCWVYAQATTPKVPYALKRPVANIPKPLKKGKQKKPNKGSATPGGKCTKINKKQCGSKTLLSSAKKQQQAQAARAAQTAAARHQGQLTTMQLMKGGVSSLFAKTGNGKSRGTTAGRPTSADAVARYSTKVVKKGQVGGKPSTLSSASLLNGKPPVNNRPQSNTGPNAHRGGSAPQPKPEPQKPAPAPPKSSGGGGGGGAKGGSKRKLSEHLDEVLPSRAFLASEVPLAYGYGSPVSHRSSRSLYYESPHGTRFGEAGNGQPEGVAPSFIPHSYDELMHLPADWEEHFEEIAVALHRTSFIVGEEVEQQNDGLINGRRQLQLVDQDDDYDDEEDDNLGSDPASVALLAGSFEEQEALQYLDADIYVEEKSPEQLAAEAAAAEALALARRFEVLQAIAEGNSTICANNYTCTWMATPWSAPDVPCGPGMVTRDISCYHSETAMALPSEWCEEWVDERPASSAFSPSWNLCGCFAEYASLADCQAGTPGLAVAVASSTVPWSSGALDSNGKPVKSAYFKCEGNSYTSNPVVKCFGTGCPAAILAGQDKTCVAGNVFSLVGRSTSYYRLDCQQPGASDTAFVPLASNTFHRALIRPVPPAANTGITAARAGVSYNSLWSIAVPSVGADTLTILVNVQHNVAFGKVPVNVTASFSPTALSNYQYTDTGVTSMVSIGPFSTATVWEGRPFDMPYESRVAGAYFPLTSVYRIRVGSTSPGFVAGATLYIKAAFDFQGYGPGNESLIEVSAFPSTTLTDASAVTRVVTVPPAWQAANASDPNAGVQPLNDDDFGNFKPASPQGLFYTYRRPSDADGVIFVSEALDADAVALGFRYTMIVRGVLSEHAPTFPFFGQALRTDTYAAAPVWWLKQGASQVTTATTKAVALNEEQFMPFAEFTASVLPLSMPVSTLPAGFTRTPSTAVSVRAVPVRRLDGLTTSPVRLLPGTQQAFVIQAPEKTSRLVVRLTLSDGADPTGVLQLHGALGGFSVNVVVSATSPDADGSYSLTFTPGSAAWSDQFTLIVYAMAEVDGKMTISTYESIDPIFPVERELAPLESHVFLARRASFFPVDPAPALASDYGSPTNAGGAASAAASVAGSAAAKEALKVAASLRRDFALVLESPNAQSPGAVSAFTGSADYFRPAPKAGNSGPSILDLKPGEAALLYRPFSPTDSYLPDLAITVSAAFSEAVKARDNFTTGFDPDTVGTGAVYRLSAAANAAAKAAGARILSARSEATEGLPLAETAAVDSKGELEKRPATTSMTPADMGIVGFGSRDILSLTFPRFGKGLPRQESRRRLSASSARSPRGRDPLVSQRWQRLLEFTADTGSWATAVPKDTGNVGGFTGASIDGGASSSSSSAFSLSPSVLAMQRQQLRFTSARTYNPETASYVATQLMNCDATLPMPYTLPVCCSTANLGTKAATSPPLGGCTQLSLPASALSGPSPLRNHVAVVSVPPETALVISITTSDNGIRLVAAGAFDKPANPSDLPAVKAGRDFAWSVVNPSITRSRLFFVVVEPASPLVTVSTPVVAVRVDPSAVIPPQFEWRTTEFTECDAVCGESLRRRSVYCAETDTGRGVDDQECVALGLTKPVSQMTCSAGACVTVASWWSDCSVACGGGISYRNLECRNQAGSGRVVPDHYCMPDIATVPREIACNTDACNTTVYRWDAGPWGPCSAPCGIGVRKRTVTCVDRQGFTVPIGLCFRWLDQVPPMANDICNTDMCVDTAVAIRFADIYKLTAPVPFAHPGSAPVNTTMATGVVDVTIPAQGAAAFRVDKPSKGVDGVCLSVEALGSTPVCTQQKLHSMAETLQFKLDRCLADLSTVYNLTAVPPGDLLTLSQGGVTLSPALQAQVSALSGGNSKAARSGMGFRPYDLLATLLLPNPVELATALVSCHANASSDAFESSFYCGGMPAKLVAASSSVGSDTSFVPAEWPLDGVTAKQGDEAGLMGDAVGYFASLSSIFKRQCIQRVRGLDLPSAVLPSTLCNAAMDSAVSLAASRLTAVASSNDYLTSIANITLAMFASAFRNTAPIPLTVPYSPETAHFVAIQPNSIRTKAGLPLVKSLFLRIQPQSAALMTAASTSSSSSPSGNYLPSEGSASTAGLAGSFDGAVFSVVNAGTMGQKVRVTGSWFSGGAAVVSGSFTGVRSDAQVRSGGLTLSVRLLCDSFLPSVVAQIDEGTDADPNSNNKTSAVLLKKSAFVAGLRAIDTNSAQGKGSSPTGWNMLGLPTLSASLSSGVGGASISFSSDMKTLTLTLPPLPAYAPGGEEKLYLSLPGILLASGHDVVLPDPVVTISADNADCLVSSFSDWSDCPQTCRDPTDTSKPAVATRTRVVLAEAKGTGLSCPALVESRECNDPCSPCDRITCANAGACVNGVCLCPSGFTGEFCQHPASTALVSAAASTSAFTPGSATNVTAVSWRAGMWLPCLQKDVSGAAAATNGGAASMSSIEQTTRTVTCVSVSCLLHVSKKLKQTYVSNQQISAACAPLPDELCLAANITKPPMTKMCSLRNRTATTAALASSKKEQVLSVQLRLQGSIAAALQMHADSSEAAQSSFLGGLSRALGLPVQFLSLSHRFRGSTVDLPVNVNVSLPIQVEIRIPESMADDPNSNATAILMRLANTLATARSAKLQSRAAQALRAAAAAIAANLTASGGSSGGAQRSMRRLQSTNVDPTLAALLDVDIDSAVDFQITVLDTTQQASSGSTAVTVAASEASGASGNPSSLLQLATISTIPFDTTAQTPTPAASPSTAVLSSASVGALIGVAVVIFALVAVLGLLFIYNRRQQQALNQRRLLLPSSPSSGAGPGITATPLSPHSRVNPVGTASAAAASALSPYTRRPFTPFSGAGKGRTSLAPTTAAAGSGGNSRPSFGLHSGGDGRHKSRFEMGGLSTTLSAKNATSRASSSHRSSSAGSNGSSRARPSHVPLQDSEEEVEGHEGRNDDSLLSVAPDKEEKEALTQR